MEQKQSPLKAVFDKYIDAAEKCHNELDRVGFLVNSLIAGYAAAAAGEVDRDADAMWSAELIAKVVIPAYEQKFNVDMDGVDMPDGWREELLAAYDAQQAMKMGMVA